MSKHFLMVVFLLSFTISFSQYKVGNVTLDFGQLNTEVKEEVIQIAGIIGNEVYTLAIKDKTYFLQKFDYSTKTLKKSVELDFEKVNGNKVSLEDLIVIGDKAYITVSYYDKKTKNYVYSARSIDNNLGLGKNINLLSIPTESKKKKGVFLFNRSYDEVNYMVCHVGIDDRKETLTYSFTLLNQDLKSELKDSYSETFENKKDLFFDFSDFIVNEFGDVFIVTSESYRDKKQKTSINNITLHSYLRDSSYEKQDLVINLEGKRAANCSLMETSNNTLQIVGFYSDIKNSGRAKGKIQGIYDVSVDYKSNTSIKETFNDFSVDLKTKLIGERKASKGKDLDPLYRNTHLIEKEDGGIFILSEYYYITVGRSGGIGPISITPVTYTANEIIVTSLDPNGVLEWSNVVPKEQSLTVNQIGFALFGGYAGGNIAIGASVMFPLTTLGSGPEFLSSLPLYNDGKLIVIVNDDPKNIGNTSIDDVKKVRNVNKMIPVGFVFDGKTGEMERVDPEDFEKKQLVIQPFTHYFLNNREVLIYGTNKEGKSLGLLKLN